ncbi:MAG: hypothetical protein J6571_05390 [Snodgrassella sp.]|uniref:hypothetical protein n=1 Tax=Snodgrassella sp. TaxID=2815304 RepID=UPI00258D2CE9|nr:hypothetical protein [Snodgrassella sp.]MCO6522605.1 hypothetical protein [Snodgrassella sp.]
MDSNIQNVIDDIYTVTKHRLDANDSLVKVLYLSLFIADKHQYIFADILKEIERHCPEYAQLDNERLSMLPDVLHMQIERSNRNSEKFVERKELISNSQKKPTENLEDFYAFMILARILAMLVGFIILAIGLIVIICSKLLDGSLIFFR